MRPVAILLSMAVLSTAALSAQTPATPAAPRPRPRPTMRARPVDSAQARYTAIRDRYRKEIDTERAVLQRSRDRMREDLVAAGWHPHRGMPGMMRDRMASWRRPMGRMGRGTMMRGSMRGRGAGFAMRRGMGRGFGPGAGMGPRPGQGAQMGTSRGGTMHRGAPGQRDQRPPMQQGNDSVRASRRPPPGTARPDSL